MFRDAHHILHNKQEWSLRPESKALRETSSLVVRLDRPLHEELHRECPAVPLLGIHALERTLRTYEGHSSHLVSMEHLMTAIEQSANHPKAHIIEKHLAELAIWSIDLQRPFVADGLQPLRTVL